MRFFSWFLLLAPVALMSACAPTLTVPIGDPQRPYEPSRPPQVGDVLHNPTGFFVDEEAMLAAAADARIVYVGETHDNPAAHRVQLRVIEAVAERHPGRVAIGMEMFVPAQQEALDRWVAGELSEREFLRESRWNEVWRMDFAYYRDILLLARDRGIAVIGLNAERDLVRQVSRQGLDELPADVAAALPEMDLDDPYQRALTTAIFAGHDAGRGDLESFVRVQTLWDETMAENIARYLGDPANAEQRMVVLAGGNHVRYGFGIPRRVYRRLPASYLIIGSKEIEVPDDKQDRLMDVELPQFPMRPYDFTVFTAYEDLPAPPVRLGVLLESAPTGVGVAGVMPDSPAAHAGIEKGDVLLEMDGTELRESFDVIYLVRQKQPGDTAQLRIVRDGTEMDIQVHFPVPDENAQPMTKDK
ncbi:ChaN family lipoprotein [Geoalkalibacter halelectricus]|uniref:ChaN family lipoprotein n=1 Tax=Geoalkalibacter halelectricus TaxID=2847045 RepID=UPI003D256412